MRADDINLHKWPEYSLCLPPQVIGSDDCHSEKGNEREDRDKMWVSEKKMEAVCGKKKRKKKSKYRKILANYVLAS